MRYSSRPPPLTSEPQPRPRFRRGKGTRYVPDVVERVRVLMVGTTWPHAVIAARVGVGVGTVQAWKVRGRWQRPQGASISTRKVVSSRAGFPRRWREAVEQLEHLALAEAERIALADPADTTTLERAQAVAQAAGAARLTVPGRRNRSKP